MRNLAASFVFAVVLGAITACHEGGESNPCSEVDCSGHGTCVRDGSRAFCRCDPGFVEEGLSCLLEGGDGDADGDADSDGDTDVDSDGDADADSDVDFDGDGDKDADSDSELSERVTDGLVALYDFEEGSGTTVHDRSGRADLVDLVIPTAAFVTWVDGGLRLDESTQVVSADAAVKIVSACLESGEVTLEAWVRAASSTFSGSGPLRIVTLSDGLYDSNIALGQGGFATGEPQSAYSVRIVTSTTGTDSEGVESAAGAVSSSRIVHVVFTRNDAGVQTLYVDGAVAGSGVLSGDLTAWQPYRLGLGNEFGDERSWLGEYHLVAFYDRALTADEVGANHDAGPNP